MENALTRAAKKKAASAKDKARHAEAELNAANEDLKDAIDQHQPTEKVKRAHSRTKAAEKVVGQAAQDMEIVEVLLDVAGGEPPTPPAGG